MNSMHLSFFLLLFHTCSSSASNTQPHPTLLARLNDSFNRLQQTNQLKDWLDSYKEQGACDLQDALQNLFSNYSKIIQRQNATSSERAACQIILNNAGLLLEYVQYLETKRNIPVSTIRGERALTLDFVINRFTKYCTRPLIAYLFHIFDSSSEDETEDS